MELKHNNIADSLCLDFSIEYSFNNKINRKLLIENGN
jgi:hypothetical protein